MHWFNDNKIYTLKKTIYCQPFKKKKLQIKSGEEGQEEWQEVVSLYHGHRGRYLFSRQREHLEGIARRKEDNALWKHQEIFHGDQGAKFSFGAERFFKDPCTCGIFRG